MTLLINIYITIHDLVKSDKFTFHLFSAHTLFVFFFSFSFSEISCEGSHVYLLINFTNQVYVRWTTETHLAANNSWMMPPGQMALIPENVPDWLQTAGGSYKRFLKGCSPIGLFFILQVGGGPWLFCKSFVCIRWSQRRMQKNKWNFSVASLRDPPGGYYTCYCHTANWTSAKYCIGVLE